ncbi:MAG: metallophosphoesterase family protein [Candidatus Omnitrophica bacterium]|nr:metallophosphoesterase family protein [Candidatus Omnitrophota bacterium]MCB9747470.1 metallophosphoesterase family protein [Candidatus Omnitrophota bacterium]
MDGPTLKYLIARLEENHLKQRLDRQKHHNALQFRGGFKVYWENLDLMVFLLHTFLRTTGLLHKGIQNSLNYELVRREVYIPSLPENFDSFTILQLSDLHIDGLHDHGDALIKAVKSINYDLCVLTGDFRFLTYGDYTESLTFTKRLIDAIKHKERIVGILGNHDFVEMIHALEEMGIEMLLNESITIERGQSQIGIAGVDDPHFYDAANLKRAGQNIQNCSTKILLAHSQEIIFEAQQAGFDLYLCGHTHGGQVCLPGKIPLIKNTPSPYRKKYITGAWQVGNMQGYTSRGAGCSGLSVRYNCPPEITLHTLKKTSK